MYPTTPRQWARAIGAELALLALGLIGFSLGMYAVGWALGLSG